MSADGQRWFLVNASPDLGQQLASSPPLFPAALRDSRVEGVLLTNADLDHVLGLFLLREGSGLAVWATPAVRATLVGGLRMDAVLRPFGRVRWSELSPEVQPLRAQDGSASGISCRAISLPGGPPPYAPEISSGEGHSVALELRDDRTGRRLLLAPDLAATTPAFLTALDAADGVLLDGTFWSEDELAAIRPGARPARAMGHLPIADGTLELMRRAPARFKAYVHINNTNPILQPDSAERAAVEAAGLIVPDDGQEFTL